MKWFNKKEVEQREDWYPETYPLLPLSDPGVLSYFGGYYRALSGISVTEESILGIPAVYRAVSLIATTVAGLPLKTYRDQGGQRVEISSFLDDPGLDLLTDFEWKELALVHLLIHGNAFFLKIFNQAGALMGLQPVHPSLVTVAWDKETGRKLYKVRTEGAERVYTDDTALHIPGLGTNGLVGLAPLSLHRLTFATEIAGNEAAGNMFANGLMIQGMIVDKSGKLKADEAKLIQDDITARMAGSRNAGKVPVSNHELDFIPMTQVARDAQFIESRAFQIEEVARVFGLMPIHLAQTEKQTSYGTGVSEQSVGLSRYNLHGWTSRIERRLSALLPRPQFVEFEFKGLLQSAPKDEVDMLIKQKEAGILTVNEVREIMNLAPLSQAELDAMKPAPPTPPPTTPAKEPPNGSNQTP